MYKVVVIDDEYWALNGVIQTFPWSKYGFEVVASATKTLEAFQYIKQLKPDVVFTDVCMPEMSGLELCEAAQKAGCTALFVFVSGFDDYKYTREALRQKAFDYCLKPIDDEETDKILSRLKQCLDEQYDETDSESLDISDITQNTQDIYNREFKMMMEYINENYTKPLLLKELAKKFYINESYCCYLFNKHFAMSFSKYLNKLRIQYAMKIIEENRTLSIDEVAERSGYASYYHFSKKFKDYTGISPAQYRKNFKTANLGDI